MKNSLSNLLVVGSVAYDGIETPFGKIDKTLGGSASYFSLAAKNFTKAAVVGVVGSDFKTADKKILADAADVSGLKTAPGKTFFWAGKYHFDLNTRDTLKTELGVFADFKPNLSPGQQKCPYVFLGNIHPKLQLSILKQIKNPKFVGLDTMNYWITKAPKDLRQVLKRVDVFVINDAEARQLSKEHNLIKAAKKIFGMMSPTAPSAFGRHPSSGRRGIQTLIIKRGEYGLLMFDPKSPSPSGRGIKGEGLKIFHLPGYPLEDVVDPTGAGDSFAGGFMGYLCRVGSRPYPTWDDLKRACVYGSVVASFCVEKMGTQRLQGLGIKDIKQRYEEFKSLTHFETK